MSASQEKHVRIFGASRQKPRTHGRQTVFRHQHGASPTACLYGLKAKIRPAGLSAPIPRPLKGLRDFRSYPLRAQGHTMP
jgi:hypothetical protein